MQQKPKIRIIKDEIVYDGQFIQVIKRYFVGRNGSEGIWEVVRRKTHGDIVGIAAITLEKEILLEKIFRVPQNAYVLELPAGLMDKEKEMEMDMVRRELREETGYEVDGVEELIRGPFNAGLIDDEIVIYLGINARLTGKPQLENAEDIEVIKVPLRDLIDYLTSQKYVKVDLKIAAVLPYLERRGLL